MTLYIKKVIKSSATSSSTYHKKLKVTLMRHALSANIILYIEKAKFMVTNF